MDFKNENSKDKKYPIEIIEKFFQSDLRELITRLNEETKKDMEKLSLKSRRELEEEFLL